MLQKGDKLLGDIAIFIRREITISGYFKWWNINKNIFTEIIPSKKIVFEHVSEPKHITVVKFEEQGDQTLVIWHMVFESVEQFREVVRKYRADEGLQQNLERFAEYLAK